MAYSVGVAAAFSFAKASQWNGPIICGRIGRLWLKKHSAFGLGGMYAHQAPCTSSTIHLFFMLVSIGSSGGALRHDVQRISAAHFALTANR